MGLRNYFFGERYGYKHTRFDTWTRRIQLGFAALFIPLSFIGTFKVWVFALGAANLVSVFAFPGSAFFKAIQEEKKQKALTES